MPLAVFDVRAAATAVALSVTAGAKEDI